MYSRRPMSMYVLFMLPIGSFLRLYAAVLSPDIVRETQHTPGAYPRHPQTPK